MGDCLTCVGVANERFSMILDDETVLNDVVMCSDCHDSFAEVPWIEIRKPSGGSEAPEPNPAK